MGLGFRPRYQLQVRLIQTEVDGVSPNLDDLSAVCGLLLAPAPQVPPVARPARPRPTRSRRHSAQLARRPTLPPAAPQLARQCGRPSSPPRCSQARRPIDRSPRQRRHRRPVTYQLQVEEARINDSEAHWQRTRSDAGLAARGTDSTLRRASSSVRLLPTSVAAAGRALSSLAAPGVGARRRLGSASCQTARRRSCQCFLLPVTADSPRGQ
jgi:hypothetical protein